VVSIYLDVVHSALRIGRWSVQMSSDEIDKSSNELIELIHETNRENDQFLRRNAESTYEEIVGLFDDSINHMKVVQGIVKVGSDYMSSTLAFLAFHMMPSFSSGVLISLLSGNLPASFMLLRLLLEATIQARYADEKYANISELTERFKLVADEKLSFKCMASRTIRNSDTCQRVVDIWKKLSSEWMHVSQYPARMKDAIFKTGNPPSWLLTIPNSYSLSDLETISVLGDIVQGIRTVLAAVISEWPDSREPKEK